MVECTMMSIARQIVARVNIPAFPGEFRWRQVETVAIARCLCEGKGAAEF